jgi:hypothetical protein
MQDEEKTIIQTLSVFVSIALLGSILVFVSALITYNGEFTTFALSGLAGGITCIIVLWLFRIKQFLIPRFFLPLAIYLLATYLIFTGATLGIRDDAVLLYSLVVAMSGLLLGRKGVVIFGALSIVTVGLSVLAEIFGYLGNYITPEMTTYTNLVNVVVIYSLTFGMMYILVNIFKTNIEKVRASQREVAEVNKELLSTRASLEKQVAERTRAAESARAEAEAARRQAESQAWLARGQANLAEQMRGELDISALAGNVTAYLSRYIGAQTGALFAAHGDVLKLTGGYACFAQAGHKSEFRFGEGLVGEAAASKTPVLLENIPPDALIISSGLGEALPRQIFIIPLESNGQVLGVLEFGTLAKFAYIHQELLQRVAESVAIALRSAQLRAGANRSS